MPLHIHGYERADIQNLNRVHLCSFATQTETNYVIQLDLGIVSCLSMELLSLKSRLEVPVS